MWCVCVCVTQFRLLNVCMFSTPRTGMYFLHIVFDYELLTTLSIFLLLSDKHWKTACSVKPTASQNTAIKQECIPVRMRTGRSLTICQESAGGGGTEGVHALGGVCSGGVMLLGRCLLPGGMSVSGSGEVSPPRECNIPACTELHVHPSPININAQTCSKNITLATTSLRPVITS